MATELLRRPAIRSISPTTGTIGTKVTASLVGSRSIGRRRRRGIIIALLVRHDRNTSTFALVLAGLAGVLAILALLLPYLTGLSGSVGGVSLALSFAAVKPEGVSAQAGPLSGHLNRVGKVTVPASGQRALVKLSEVRMSSMQSSISASTRQHPIVS